MVGPIAGAKVTASENIARPIGCCALRQLGEDERECHRNQHAAEKSLEGAQRDHRRQVGGEGTGDREGGEQARERQHDLAEGKDAAEVIGQRDHDDLADQIGGRDPGAVVDAGADAAFDVEQRGVGDLDVEDRHERADHGGEDGDPDGGAGARGLGG